MGVTNNRVKAQVIQRDDALLTAAETKERWTEVSAAMDKELRTWVKLGCVSRKPRAQARNIIDTRWVLKWKWDQPTVSVHAASKTTQEAIRVIRARLTIRGFKDVEKDDVD